MTIQHSEITAPRLRGAFAAEAARFVNRRGLRTGFLATVVVFAVAVIAMAVYYAPATAEDVQKARTEYAQAVADATASHDQCAASLPPGSDLLTECGPPLSAQDLGDVTQSFTTQPFLLDITMPKLARGIGLLFALAAFFLGAAWVGGDWTSGSMTVLATYEPRRTRLLAVKAAVLAVLVAGYALALQLVWVATSFGLARWRGNSAVHLVDWPQLLGLQGRAIILAVLTSLAGFALANLLRSTTWVLGLAFGYALVVEGAMRWLTPGSGKWFVSENLQAFLAATPRVLTWDDGSQLFAVTITQAHAAALLTITVAGFLVIGAAIFSRSDLA